jgi:predicted lipoprotein with Yx(FWY)xxD motif
MRKPANTTFATNADTPMTGKSLYRFSKGHGGLQCSACHGSTHAEWPSVHTNDNILATNLQGHAGVLVECMACHSAMPETISGGPHGMHPVGSAWLDHHGDAAKKSTNGECQACHGSTFRGSVLARTKAARTFSHDGRTMNLWSGKTLGCYECHNGPSGEGSAPTAPTVSSSVAITAALGVSSVTKTITTTPTRGVTLRIVNQPQHGTAAVNGTAVVYYPFAGYHGPDAFTFAASNGTRESNLGKATVTVK